MTQNQIIAGEILKQLGGQKRLSIMTGANCFLAHEQAVSFKLKNNSNPKNINYIKIELNGNDTYDVKFQRFNKTDIFTIEEHKDIYADMLMDLFEEVTGLYLTFSSRAG
jgi:hypothetical protein